MKPRIMYIELKDDGISGPGRIGRVTFSRSGQSIYYRGRRFHTLSGNGFKANYFDWETGEHCWISGCKKLGGDRLYPGKIEIDDVVIGTPCNDPRAFFPPGAATAASAAFALARARSASTVANAFNLGFRLWILARCASTSSTGEISPARTCSAIPISDPYTIPSTWPPRTPRKPLQRAAVYHAVITGHRPIAGWFIRSIIYSLTQFCIL
jgi:hypothetical protein